MSNKIDAQNYVVLDGAMGTMLQQKGMVYHLLEMIFYQFQYISQMMGKYMIDFYHLNYQIMLKVHI